MLVKCVRFVTLLLVGLTLGLLWAHVLEWPGKLRLASSQWLAVQHNLYIAFGPPMGAPIEVASILLTWVLFWLVRRRRPAAWLTLAAAVCVTCGLAVWFWLVAPMNAVLNAWTPEALPVTWTDVRDQWETGQAIHAALFGAGFGALILALLVEMP